MKTKHVFLGIVAASTLLILFLIVAIFNSSDNEWSFQFLNQYEEDVEQRRSWATRNNTGEHVRYHLKADYDRFTEAAKSELLAQGFNDITEPNKYYERQVYEKQAFEHIRVEIRFAIIRSGPAINNPVHFWIDVKVNRTKPKSSIKYYWNNLKREFVKIKFKLKYNQPL